MDKGEVQAAFFMNATKVEQVLAACEAGFVLPQKSTYFLPKLATGLRHVPPRRPGAAAGAREMTSGSTAGSTHDKDITADTLRGGRVRIFQPARGARMSLDPVLLEGFLPPPHGRFLDIGCGTGALSFLLLARDPVATGVGVELQPRLAALAARGRDENGWQQRLEIAVGDVRGLGDRLGAATFDLVATNPPYRTLAGSRRPPDEERALAHQEIALALAGVGRLRRARRPTRGASGGDLSRRARRRSAGGDARV